MMVESTAADKASTLQTDLLMYLAGGGVMLYTGWAVSIAGFALPVLLVIPVLALLLPFSRTAIKQKIGFILRPGWCVAIGFVFVLSLGIMLGDAKAKAQADAQARMQQESAARITKVKAEREAEYAKNKAQIITRIEQQLANNQPREALGTINKFMLVTKDPDLGRHQYRAELQVMRLDLRNEANLSLERRSEIYTTLIREEPANSEVYQRKLKEIEPQIAAVKKLQEDTTKRAAMEGNIQGQFSGYDGSHRKVEAAIKARLKDPSSYEHVNTKYIVDPETITVYTTYRARNSFNALTTSIAIATVDGNGNVLTIN